jgi:integrase
MDASGRRLDFHALRATFCTLLALARVPLNEAMHLMRHSDPKLTMKVYTDAAQLDLSTALSALPSVPQLQRNAV